MRNIKLTLQYDGTGYSGWQVQKNSRSIQEVIEKRLAVILGEKVKVTGSGRTDSGVHARGQIANFKTRLKIPLKNIQMALNSALPKDIVVSHIDEAPLNFDSQRSAKAKTYRYTVVNGDFCDPFIRRYAARYFYSLDIPLMRSASRYLLGRHDFRAFKTNDGMGEKNTVRTVKEIRIKKDGNIVYFDVKADGFLYNMVRNIAGTLIEIGRGKMKDDFIKAILKKKDRKLCGPTAPAKGLCLLNVEY